MSKAFKCDICGEFYCPYNTSDAIRDANGIRFVKENAQGEKRYSGECLDCCPSCLNAITDIINSRKRSEKDENPGN